MFLSSKQLKHQLYASIIVKSYKEKEERYTNQIYSDEGGGKHFSPHMDLA